MKNIEPAANNPAIAAVVAGALTLLTKDQIKAGQDSIKKSLTKLDMAIHANAVQCLLHAEKHGDTSLMRRLLVEIIDDKTGYRRQGLINWMRKHSPMELKGTTINLSGLDDKGNKRVFDVPAADAKPFWQDEANREKVAKPVWTDTLLSQIDSAERNFRVAIQNTANGKPIDPTKPFFDGRNDKAVLNFFDEVQKLRAALPVDHTRETRMAQAAVRKATAGLPKEERQQVLKSA